MPTPLVCSGSSPRRSGDGARADILRPYESQWLLQRRLRLYGDLPFAAMRRCQLDIETGASEAGAFSDAQTPGDRVLAITACNAGTVVSF